MTSKRQPAKSAKPLTLLAIVTVLLTYLVLLASGDFIYDVAGKEQILEVAGAFLYLGSAVVAVLIAFRIGKGGSEMTGKKWFLILMSAVFFFAFGEETSWGQHFFGFDTPEFIRQRNTQNELSLHNLEYFDSYTLEAKRKTGLAAVFSANRGADAFMIGLFWVVPILTNYWQLARKIFLRVGVFILPVLFGLPLLLNIAMTGLAEAVLVDGRFLHRATSEIREFNYALLCLLAMLYLSQVARSSGSSKSENP